MSHRVGPFKLIRKIGSGTSANVVEAVDERSGARVALKVPYPDRQATERHRLQIEAEAARGRGVAHPNVVRLLEVAREPEVVALVLELVDGIELASMLQAGGPLPSSLASLIGLDIALGLDAIHSAVDAEGGPLGLVHGDVGPRNVLVGTDGMVRITDFGMARRRAVSVVSVSGLIRGTPGYIAPEVVRGQPPSSASDLFAVGMVLHEAVSGAPVFGSLRPVDALRATVEQRIPEVPGELGALIALCTRKRPESRIRSARALAEALGSLADLSGRDLLARRVLSARGAQV